MGFQDRRTNAKFVNISRGKFAFKDNGQLVLTDQELVGTLTDIAIVDDEYQGDKFKKLCLTIDDGKEAFQLQMKMGSGYANAFCMCIQNADVSQPIGFSCSYDDSGDKPKTSMFLKQNKTSLKWFYTKNDPKDLPQLVPVEFKGKKMWDNSAQQEFLTEILLHKIKPSLSHGIMAGAAGEPAASSPAGLGASSTPAADITEPIDDLPF
jgi:hypothetical protein